MLEAVNRFRAWASSVDKRSYWWAYNYESFFSLVDLVCEFIVSTPLERWTDDERTGVLFVCAADVDQEKISRAIAVDPACLRQLARAEAEPECRSQLATRLGEQPAPESEALLLELAADAHGYVRQCALASLAGVGSVHTEDLADQLWRRSDPHREHTRITVLGALRTIGSPWLEGRLVEAEMGDEPLLAEYARKLLPPVPSIPIARMARTFRGARSLAGAPPIVCRPGNTELRVVPLELRVDEHSALLLAEVTLETRGGRGRARPGLLGKDSEMPRHIVILEDVEIDVRPLARFCAQARTWLNLTIAELRSCYFVGEFELGSEPGGFQLKLESASCERPRPDEMVLTVFARNIAGHGSLQLTLDYPSFADFIVAWENAEVP